MVNRVIQHGKAEAQSALGSIKEIRTPFAEGTNFSRTSTRRSGRFAFIRRRECRQMTAAQVRIAVSLTETSAPTIWLTRGRTYRWTNVVLDSAK